MTMEDNKSFGKAVKEAEQMAKDPATVEVFADKAHAKARKAEHQLKGVKRDLDSFVRLVRAWATGKYKDVGWSTIVIVLGAVVYFVNPFDAMPDFLPLIGLSDDLSIIALAVTRVRKELDKFHDWETEITLK